MKTHYEIIIIGGGLAGLVSAILLSRSGKDVLLIEKNSYPFHKVCGEYVSNEVLEVLKAIGFDPFLHGAASISKFRISDRNGKSFYFPLDLGGFGLSRYKMDFELFKLAEKSGTTILQQTKITSLNKLNNSYTVELNSGNVLSANLVIPAYGKRDALDRKLNRSFILQRSPFMGVKYHVRSSYPIDEVGIDNFENGYCGIVKIEEDRYNLCYLYRHGGKKIHSLQKLEEKVLFKNGKLKDLFTSSTQIEEAKVVINEISFRKKNNDEFAFTGDAAGLITPICGNGMALAISSAVLLSDVVIQSGNYKTVLKNYNSKWHNQFALRLQKGRILQSLLLNNPVLSVGLISAMQSSRSFAKAVISQSHGKMIRKEDYSILSSI